MLALGAINIIFSLGDSFLVRFSIFPSVNWNGNVTMIIIGAFICLIGFGVIWLGISDYRERTKGGDTLHLTLDVIGEVAQNTLKAARQETDADGNVL